MVMFGNGVRTTGMIIIKGHLMTGVLGRIRMGRTVCFAVAAGAIVRGIAGRRAAATARRAIAAMPSASASSQFRRRTRRRSRKEQECGGDGTEPQALFSNPQSGVARFWRNPYFSTLFRHDHPYATSMFLWSSGVRTFVLYLTVLLGRDCTCHI